jgi:hypothetical protein
LGTSVHEFAWSTAVIAGTGAAQYRIAMDRSDGTVEGTLYVVYADDDQTGAVSVAGYNRENAAWETLGDSFGTTDINLPGIIDLCAYNGNVYAAYSDKGLGGKVTVRRFNETEGTWEIYPGSGSEGFSTGTNARFLSMDVDTSTGDPYIGYIYTSGGDDYIETSSDFTGVTNIAGGLSELYTSFILAREGGSYYAFEDESTPGSESIETNAPNDTQVETGSNLRNNYLDFIVVSDSEMYIAYYTDAFYVKKYNGTNWDNDITPVGITASSSAASVALAYDRNPSSPALYLFYRDSFGGIVMKYSGSGTVWETRSVDEETDAIAISPSSLQLEAYKNYMYASYLTGGTVQMRVWE